METVLEYLGILAVIAVVHSAAQSESPRQIARSAARLFIICVVAVTALAGAAALVSSL
jgi:hypothetical protein